MNNKKIKIAIYGNSTHAFRQFNETLNALGFFSFTIQSIDEYTSSDTGNPDILIRFLTADTIIQCEEILTLQSVFTESRIVITGTVQDLSLYSDCADKNNVFFLTYPITKNILYQTIHSIVDTPFQGSSISLPQSSDSKPTALLYHELKNQNISLQKAMSYINTTVKKKERYLHAMEEKERHIERQLIAAVDNKQFRMYYQPVVNISTGKLAGFESLIRWEHPDEGLVPPDEFIPVAEKSPVMIPLGFWIIESVVQQIAAWHSEFGHTFKPYVNINLSPRQFVHPELVEDILDIVKRYNIEHDYINFEITESAFMDDMEAANLMLLKLKKEKFKLYMDDFGTGYSSLTYLLHFPMDTIKIDKSFVQWMHIEDNSAQIVRSVIYLAHNLNMTVVTEGVESEEHIDMLKEMGSDYGQGYFYAKPLKVEDATEFIKSYIASA